jgi:hypothetical protein
MSRVRQRIQLFDIELTIYPEIKQQIFDLASTIITLIENSEDDKPYLRELLHHLSITYNLITITDKDKEKYANSTTSE